MNDGQIASENSCHHRWHPRYRPRRGKTLRQRGRLCFVTGHRQKELEEAVASIGDNVTGVQGDVMNLADLDRLYESVKAKGRIDILFANVGLGGFAPLGSITEDYYDKTFDTNVKGLLFTVQKALPFLNVVL